MLTIYEHPFSLVNRTEAGHWDGDLIIGRDQGSAIGTLVERQTRVLRLLHLPARDSETPHDALAARMGDLLPEAVAIDHRDQGTEMARHTAIAATLGTKIYFCDSRSP